MELLRSLTRNSVKFFDTDLFMLPIVMPYWNVQKHSSRCLGSSLVSRRAPKEQRHLGGQAATKMMFFKS